MTVCSIDLQAAELRTYKTPTDFDKLRQFLEMDRKVLRFYCVWDDRDKMFGQMRKFILHVSAATWYCYKKIQLVWHCL